MKKAFLILLVIVCLAVAGWNAYLLFTNQTDPLIGWIILAVSIGVLFWNISVLRAYRIGAGSVVAVFVIIALMAMTVSAFAGIEPFAGIKDSVVSRIGDIFESGEDAAARRVVRATIDAFNKGRGDRLADLTVPSVRDELMFEISVGRLLGGFKVIDYELYTTQSSETWCVVRVRGGLKTLLGVDVYDKGFVVSKVDDKWVVTEIIPYDG